MKWLLPKGSGNDGNYPDAEIQALYSTTGGETSKDQPSARLEQSDGQPWPISDGNYLEDFLNADESGSAVEKQQAEWSKKLSDSKLKEKSAKYLRPANCETLATPRVDFLKVLRFSFAVPVENKKISSSRFALVTNFELDLWASLGRKIAAMISAGKLDNLEVNNFTFLSLIWNRILLIRCTASSVANGQIYVKWKEYLLTH